MTVQVFAERDLAEAIEHIRQSEAAGLISWMRAAELIAQLHDQADAILWENSGELNVFQLARLRLTDLRARFLMTRPPNTGGNYGVVLHAVRLNGMSREQLVDAILEARL